MSLGQVNSALNLLGQGGAATAARMAPAHEATAPAAHSEAGVTATAATAVVVEPKLGVAWGDFHQGHWSNLRAFFAGPFPFGKFLGSEYFRDCWVERRVPKRAVVAAALWHVVFLLAPFSLLTATIRHNPAFDHTQLTWSGPIEDFPLLDIRAAKPKVATRAETAKAITPKSTEAFHPRQRIVTDPVRPNHPRQTLIHAKSPEIAPKVLPELPNIVQLQGAAAPTRPRVEISADALAKLHPRERRKVATAANALAPEVAALDAKPADITLSPSTNAPARPKLDLNAGASPRAAERTQSGDAVAPELAAQTGNGSQATLVALSAAPAPAKPEVQPPDGNLAARMAVSPEGKKSVAADASVGANASAAGKSEVGISISGGNPSPKSNNTSGAGGNVARAALSLPSAHSLMTRPEPKADTQTDSEAAPNFAALAPGAKPEQVFGPKRVYTLAVNMANLNSASGSWILHFAEMGAASGAAYASGAATPTLAADLAMPVPTRKVDPKYPPDLIEQNVQGEVVLYGVIRADGSVNGIQVVRGVDPQLDANAKWAFAQWKFAPASKGGTAVPLQVIAYIPFKIRDDR
jgi:TonB family protein